MVLRRPHSRYWHHCPSFIYHFRLKLIPSANYSYGTIKRMRRHGTEYDIILDHYIDDLPAPFGLLCKSHKTGRYVWFSRDKVIECQDISPTTHHPLPEMIQGIRSSTPNPEMLAEYLSHSVSEMSKRDQKKYGELYEEVEIACSSFEFHS